MPPRGLDRIPVTGGPTSRFLATRSGMSSLLSASPSFRRDEPDDSGSSAAARSTWSGLSGHPFPAGFVTMLDEPLSGFCGQVRAGFDQSPNQLPTDVLCTLGNTPALRVAAFPVVLGLFRVLRGVFAILCERLWCREDA